jgi:hypothetical protein
MNQLLKLPSKFLKKIPMLFNRRQFKKSYRKLSHLEFDQVKLARQLGHHYKTFQRQPKSRKALLLGSLFLITLTPLAIFLARNPKEVRSWWNDNWQYRIKATITEQTGASLTDFQVAITLDTATLISAGKMQADCDDLRIYDLNHTVLQNYWVDTCDSSTTKIWLKQSFSANEAKYYYVYYGNPNAQNSETDGTDIFIFFDDFSGTNLKPNWTEVTAGGATAGTISNGLWTKTCDGECDWWNTTDLDAGAYVPFPTISEADITWEATTRLHSTTSSGNKHIGMMLHQAVRDGYIWGRVPSANNYRVAITGSDNQCSISSTTTPANLKIRKTTANGVGANNSFTFWLDTGSGWTQCGTYAPSDIMSNVGLMIKDWDSGSTFATYDYFYIKHYATTEPTNSNAAEESAEGPVGYWKFDESANVSYSQPLNPIEQHISLLNQAFTTYSDTYTPDNNALGTFRWDADKYPGATVYLEATMYSNHQFDSGQVALYTSTGDLVANSTISYNDGTGYVRSSALTLADNTDYTIRIRTESSTYWFYTTVYSANLVIIQSGDAADITSTQAQIDIGDNLTTTSNSYTTLTDPKIYYHDSSKFSPSPTAYFEASLKGGDSPTIEQQINITNQIFTGSGTSYVPTDNSLGIFTWDATKYSGTVSVYLEVDMYDNYDYFNGAKVALYDTSGNVVTSSITNIPDANTSSHSRYRSAAITDLVSGTSYTVRAADAAGTDGFSLKAARLIVIQTNPTKIQTTQTQIEVGNYQAGITSTTYAELTDPKYYLYDAAQFSPTIESSGDASFSATLKIDDTGDTAYAELYNRTNGTTVAEVSHTGDTNWTYKTISNIDGDADWDTTNDDEYVVRVKCVDGNGGGCSANIANAKIHLNQFAADGITNLEVIHHQINTARTDADATYTDQDYLIRYNPSLESTQVSFAGGNFAYYFESTLKTSAGTGYAQLRNDSLNYAISGSEITTTSTSYERKRSADITSALPTFPTTYGGQNLDTQLKNSATNTTTSSSSWLIIDVNQLSNSGITTAYAELYNLTDSVVVSGSEVTNATSNWSRVRSSALNLTTDKEYVVRIKSGVNNLPISLASARVILDQSDAEGVSATELIWPMINTARTDADATYTDQDYLLSYNPSNVDLNFSSIFFESTLKTSAGTGYAQLKNDTDGTAITGSEITTTSTSYDRVRSSALQTALPTATKNLDTQLKNSASNTTTASSSWLVIQANQSIPVITHDSTTQQNHGSVESATWEQGCFSQSCLKYDGTDDHVWVTDSTNHFDFAAVADFTLTGWFKSGKSTATQVLLAKYETTGSDGGYKVYLNSSGTVSFGIDDDDTSFPEDVATSTVTYDDSSWHHFAAVKDGTASITLYIDGLPVAEDTSIAATGTLANDDKLYFGIDGDATSNPFSGWLDEFKVYPYARTPDEIKVDYTGSATVLGISTTNKSLTDNLVLHWPLDEAATPAVDSSGNDNGGTWQGNAAVISGKLSSAIDLDGTTDRVDTANDNNIPQTYSWPISMSSWSKRKPITHTNNVASVLTNYQVELTIPYSPGMQPDFDDLRFTNSADIALDYWLESKTDSTTATVWVEVDSLPASTNTTIYMYYDNSTATSESSSANTMIMFEDMEAQPAGTLKSNATYDATNKYTQLTAASSSVNGQLEYAATPAVGWATYWKQWTGGGSGADALYFYTNASSTPTNEDASINGYIFTADEYSDQLQVRYNGSIWTVAQTGIDNSAWHTVKNVLYQSGATYYFQFWYDGILKISNSSSSAPSGS